MRELYRRYGALALVLTAAVFFLSARGELLRLHEVDMGREYMSAYVPRTGFDAVSAGRSFIRSTTSFKGIAEFIDEHTRGRLSEVRGEEWNSLFAGILPDAEASPFAERSAEYAGRLHYFFLPSEKPFQDIARRMNETDQSFGYLKMSSPSGPRFLGLTRQGPDDALRAGAPSSLVFPLRRFAAVPLILGLSLYLLLPRRKTSPGALVYTRLSYVGGDVAGMLLTVLFFALPFFIVREISGGSPLDFSDGSVVITLIFWLLAALGASIFWFSARYASFSIDFVHGGILHRVLGRERRIPWAAIDSVDFADYSPPKWLKALVLLGSLLNPRMMAGQAMILSGRSDRGLALRLKGGETVKFACTRLVGIERLFEAFRRERVTLSPELESLLARPAASADEE